MTEFVIDVIVDPSKTTGSLDKVDGRLNKLEKSGNRLQSTLRRAITLVGLVAAARQLGTFADSLTNVQNRIRLVTRDSAQLNAVTKKLFDIAAKTRTGFAATATIFSRTALAVKDLGLSLQETLDFTEALNQAIVLSGVKAQEANAGLIQLSQGLASGTLRGDELRSVLEQLPKVADLIANELGVLRGELRILGEQGKITTADIIKAFTGIAASDLTKAFADSVPTISQGLSVLTTRVIQYIGQVDAANGISVKLAKGLIFLSDNLENVGKVAIVAGAALAGPFAKAGVLFAAGAVRALTVAILANPLGALVVFLAAAITAIVQFGDSISVTEDGLVSLKDVALATWQFILSALEPLIESIKKGFKTALNFVINAFGTLNLTFKDVLAFGKTFVNSFIGLQVGMAKALQSIFNDLGAVFSDVIGDGLIKSLGRTVKSLLKFALDGLKLIAKFAGTILTSLGGIAAEINDTINGFNPDDKTFVGTFRTIAKRAKDAFAEGFGQDFVGDILGGVAPVLKQIEASAKKISEARGAPKGGGAGDDQGIGDKGEVVTQLPFALREQLRRLKEEGETLKGNNRERGIQTELLKLEEKLRASNVSLNDTTRALLETEVRRLTGLREQADVLDGIVGPQEELSTKQEALNALYQRGSVSLKVFNNEMKLLNLSQRELNAEQGSGGFVDGFITGIGSMLEAVRSFASEAGLVFSEFFTMTTEGFSEAIAGAIVFGDSLSDSIGNAARSAVASLLSGLIDIGIQFLLNTVLSDTLAQTQIANVKAVGVTTQAVEAATTVSSVTASTTTTAAIVTDQAAIATAAAPAAALTSVSSFGGAAIAGLAALAAILAFSQSFASGGFVTGPGSTTSDSIPAMLSDKEFVVNAKATARFRPQLEAINDGGGGEIFEAPASGGSNLGSGGGGSATGDVKIINVLDPSLVEDFMTSTQGEQVIVNSIERNAGAINQVLRNN